MTTHLSPARTSVASHSAATTGQRARRAMTVGELSRRTKVPVRKLRQYEDMGMIHSLGRSPSGYRLFDDDALWCVAGITTLRSLGLTEAEIQRLAEHHDRPENPIGPRLAEALETARARTRDQIDDLTRRLDRIDEFTRTHRAVLAGHDTSTPWGPDACGTVLDSA